MPIDVEMSATQPRRESETAQCSRCRIILGKPVWMAILVSKENRSGFSRFRRFSEQSALDFVQAIRGFAGLAGVRYRSLFVQRLRCQLFSCAQYTGSPATPIFPPSGRAAGSSIGLHPQSNFQAMIIRPFLHSHPDI
jgi:hypothetical protein